MFSISFVYIRDSILLCVGQTDGWILETPDHSSSVSLREKPAVLTVKGEPESWWISFQDSHPRLTEQKMKHTHGLVKSDCEEEGGLHQHKSNNFMVLDQRKSPAATSPPLSKLPLQFSFLGKEYFSCTQLLSNSLLCCAVQPAMGWHVYTSYCF